MTVIPSWRLLLGLQWGPGLACLLPGACQAWILSWMDEAGPNTLFSSVALTVQTGVTSVRSLEGLLTESAGPSDTDHA